MSNGELYNVNWSKDFFYKGLDIKYYVHNNNLNFIELDKIKE